MTTKNLMQKFGIAMVTLATVLAGTAFVPAFAFADKGLRLGASVRTEAKVHENENEQEGGFNGNLGIGIGSLNIDIEDASGSIKEVLKPARKEFKAAVKEARSEYKDAKKATQTDFKVEIKAATDQPSKIAAIKTYFSKILAALIVRNNAIEAAFSALINFNFGGNHAPTANAQNVSLNENTSLNITLTGSDPESSPLTYAIVTATAHGTLTGSAPNVTYTPNANFNGTDSFTFKVNDGSLNSITATVSITINGVNQAPTANGQTFSLAKNTSANITLTGSDPEGSVLSYIVVNTATHGIVSGIAPNLMYTPDTNFTGSDNFTFKVNDGFLDSPLATVSMSVTP